jgi:hypothetical protein
MEGHLLLLGKFLCFISLLLLLRQPQVHVMKHGHQDIQIRLQHLLFTREDRT